VISDSVKRVIAPDSRKKSTHFFQGVQKQLHFFLGAYTYPAP